MIGQIPLLEKIQTQIEDDVFPKFSIFVGAKGMGKKTLMREITTYMPSYEVHELADVKIDTIRGMIDEAVTKASSGAKIIYIIPDSENMSEPAKNSILKITEEPPKGAYFLMSVSDIDYLLDTIRNRAAIFYMRPYSVDEKQKYLDSLKSSINDSERDLILNVSYSLYDIELLLKSSPGELEKYATKLIDSFEKSTPSKLLSSIKDIAFKEDAEGYNLILFWRVCLLILGDRIKKGSKDDLMYSRLVSKTIEKMGETRFNSVSKEHTFDMWLLDCRKIVRKWKDGDKRSQTADTQ